MKSEESDKTFTINDIEIGLERKTCEDTTKTGTIYLIQNNINCNRYVGQTIQKLGRRWATHKNERFKKIRPLYKAMLEYGVENFTIAPIEINVGYAKLDELEKKYIKEYQSFIDWGKGGYNLTTGGSGLRSVSQETRDKLHRIHFGRPKSAQHSLKVGLSNRGKPNARTNRDIVSFINDDTKEIFTGIRKDFYHQYKLDTRKIYDLLTGRRLSHMGWRINSHHYNCTPHQQQPAEPQHTMPL